MCCCRRNNNNNNNNSAVVMREVGNVVRLVFTLLVLAVFGAALSPDTLMLSGKPEFELPSVGGNASTTITSQYTELGVAVLMPGMAISRRRGHSRVLWWDLTSENVCRPDTAIYRLWSEPNGMCHACGGNDDGSQLCFAMPADATFKIAIVCLTVILAGLLALVQLMDLMCCGKVYCCWPLEVTLTLLVVASAVLTFPFWTTTGASSLLSEENKVSVVPVFPLNGTGPLIPSTPVHMSRTHGYNLMIAGLVFAVLNAFALCLPRGASPAAAATAQPPQANNNDDDDEDDDEKKKKKAACCGLLCCCSAAKAGAASEPASPPPPPPTTEKDAGDLLEAQPAAVAVAAVTSCESGKECAVPVGDEAGVVPVGDEADVVQVGEDEAGAVPVGDEETTKPEEDAPSTPVGADESSVVTTTPPPTSPPKPHNRPAPPPPTPPLTTDASVSGSALALL